MNGRNHFGKILAIIVSAAIIVLTCVLIAQRVGNYVAIKTQITMERLLLGQDEQGLAQLESLSKRDKEITDAIETCKKLIPEGPQEDELIKYIHGSANEAMADFIQITFDPRIQADSYVVMPVKITFEGKYTALIDFLKKLRNGERAFRVDGISVTPSGNGDSSVKADLTANAFCLAAAGTASTQAK